VRGVLSDARDRMFELVEGCINVAWHGDVDMYLFVFPGDGEPAIKGTCPVSGDGVDVCEGLDEMFGVVVANVFYSEVVDDEGEGDWARGVLPKSGCAWRRVVVIFCQIFGEALICNNSGLFEAILFFYTHPSWVARDCRLYCSTISAGMMLSGSTRKVLWTKSEQKKAKKHLNMYLVEERASTTRNTTLGYTSRQNSARLHALLALPARYMGARLTINQVYNNT
jgi:hypothetical protein